MGGYFIIYGNNHQIYGQSLQIYGTSIQVTICMVVIILQLEDLFNFKNYLAPYSRQPNQLTINKSFLPMDNIYILNVKFNFN